MNYICSKKKDFDFDFACFWSTYREYYAKKVFFWKNVFPEWRLSLCVCVIHAINTYIHGERENPNRIQTESLDFFLSSHIDFRKQKIDSMVIHIIIIIFLAWSFVCSFVCNHDDNIIFVFVDSFGIYSKSVYTIRDDGLDFFFRALVRLRYRKNEWKERFYKNLLLFHCFDNAKTKKY